MNIQQALQQGAQALSETSDSATLDAQVLLSHILQCNSAHLVAWPEKDLSTEQTSHYLQLVQQRENGLPVAHLTGSREFWSLDFQVENSTLIPRPETETLVEYILENFASEQDLKLLDMGTGTGAIALAIASEKPGWNIYASDSSKPALALATQNSQQLGIDSVNFILSDWFDKITEQDFDIIVSNPPYIAEHDPHLSQGDVRFEPQSALTSGASGMDDIEHLCQYAKNHLVKNGWLILEHGYDQNKKVSDCFAKNGYTQIEQKKDLSEHLRMTAGTRKF